ncbi:major facilitator superfamily domain-containing protein [Auriculariales sp. MPI-PUGE-AT-0066]|nr:major facilitator superfamily domain-containing protein [Auriculariales sp. MPI-PUGE-AT-0066]
MSHDASRHRLRIAQTTCAVFFSVACSGVVFGYAALKPVLIRQGVYAGLCDPNEVKSQPCAQQEHSLNFIFTIAAVVSNVAALPVGAFLDYAGPLYTSLLGATLFALGSFVFGLGWTTPVDTYQLGFGLFAVGGPLTFLPQLHLPNAFPSRSGLVMAFLTGAFGVSSIPFVLLYWLDKSVSGGIPLRTFFWSYCAIPALLVVQQIAFGPRTQFTVDEHLLDAESAESEGIVVTYETISRSDLDEYLHIDAPTAPKDAQNGVITGQFFSQQVASRWFLAIVIFLCIQAARINWYIQTTTAQLQWYLGSSKAQRLSEAFGILLPLGGVAFIPLAGYLLDRHGRYRTLAALLVIGFLYGILGLVASTTAQLFGMVVFVVFRPLMYTFVNDYSVNIFGPETFGRVLGLASLIAGLFGFILQPLDVAVSDHLRGSYTLINVFGLIAGAVASVLLGWTMRPTTASGRIRLD